ncbi:hypothetical protein BDZ91DRAFT_715426 [Kalaharituber pfeilii]|nr:hypothetical protein BDZ91DRAFT_715426 [Kalaharituber pfeilii]
MGYIEIIDISTLLDGKGRGVRFMWAYLHHYFHIVSLSLDFIIDFFLSYSILRPFCSSIVLACFCFLFVQ